MCISSHTCCIKSIKKEKIRREKCICVCVYYIRIQLKKRSMHRASKHKKEKNFPLHTCLDFFFSPSSCFVRLFATMTPIFLPLQVCHAASYHQLCDACGVRGPWYTASTVGSRAMLSCLHFLINIVLVLFLFLFCCNSC